MFEICNFIASLIYLKVTVYSNRCFAFKSLYSIRLLNLSRSVRVPSSRNTILFHIQKLFSVQTVHVTNDEFFENLEMQLKMIYFLIENA